MPRSATATASSPASAAARSRPSAWRRRSATATNGSCSSRTSRRWARTGSRCTSAAAAPCIPRARWTSRSRRPPSSSRSCNSTPRTAAGCSTARRSCRPRSTRRRRSGRPASRRRGRPSERTEMATTHPQRVIDAHCHIGEIPPWKFYDLEHPVKPTVYDYRSPAEFVKNHMDEFKIERALAMSNYGVPVHEISFDLNDVVMEAATTNDRILAAIWVSFLPRNAEMTREALKLASESRVVALKTTFLLGGNPDPNSWDDETRAIADECFDVCEQHDLIFHFHTSPGGNSDISNFIPLVERYGKRCKIYLVHFGGGVSGHIRLVPKFLQWVQDGYQVYTDTSWAIGFGARWLLTEIERTGVGGDRVFFGSDEPWSDFDSEYWKLNGIRDISQELKDRVFWRNYEEAFGTRA